MGRIITSIIYLCGVFALTAQDNILDREQLSGDWSGKRSNWAAAGYEFTFNYDVEVFRNNSGGTSKGTVIDGPWLRCAGYRPRKSGRLGQCGFSCQHALDPRCKSH